MSSSNLGHLLLDDDHDDEMPGGGVGVGVTAVRPGMTGRGGDRGVGVRSGKLSQETDI